MEQVRKLMLEKLDPPRTTRRQHRQRTVGFKAVKELGGFLPNREVGAEIGVEYAIETQCSQSGHQASGSDGSGWLSKHLGNRHPDGRGHLDDHKFGGVVQYMPQSGDMVHLQQRPGGADSGTLTAERAFGFNERAMHGRIHDTVKPSLGITQNTNCLNQVTSGFASPTHDALVHIPNDGK